MAKETRVPGKVQPARADEIQYKAYARKFELGTVLFLTATCSYPVGPYEIYFQGAGGFNWTLMEKAPGIFYNLVTYHIASTTTGQPLLEIPNTVTVVDGYGSHRVSVEKGAAKAK
jgi:hypothetical protein